MTIAERKAREAYDRENPWRPMSTAKPSGLICELLFNDMAGGYANGGQQFFLDEDGWWRIDDPAKVWDRPSPMNWRPTYVMLSPERRALIKRRAKGEDA